VQSTAWAGREKKIRGANERNGEKCESQTSMFITVSARLLYRSFFFKRRFLW
jgi:hypothetical protein